MDKVELAKMLGLAECQRVDVDRWDIRDLINNDYLTIDREFCSDITAIIDEEDFKPHRLDIKLSDLEKEEDIKVCIKQCEDLLWERAADQYLEKIKNLVETIKV